MSGNKQKPVFTDDYLKRLKECDCVDGWHRIRDEKLKALIARLEAAETALLKYHKWVCGEYNEIPGIGHPTYQAWRKAAGK